MKKYLLEQLEMINSHVGLICFPVSMHPPLFLPSLPSSQIPSSLPLFHLVFATLEFIDFNGRDTSLIWSFSWVTSFNKEVLLELILQRLSERYFLLCLRNNWVWPLVHRTWNWLEAKRLDIPWVQKFIPPHLKHTAFEFLRKLLVLKKKLLQRQRTQYRESH